MFDKLTFNKFVLDFASLTVDKDLHQDLQPLKSISNGLLTHPCMHLNTIKNEKKDAYYSYISSGLCGSGLWRKINNQ